MVKFGGSLLISLEALLSNCCVQCVYIVPFCVRWTRLALVFALTAAVNARGGGDAASWLFPFQGTGWNTNGSLESCCPEMDLLEANRFAQVRHQVSAC